MKIVQQISNCIFALKNNLYLKKSNLLKIFNLQVCNKLLSLIYIFQNFDGNKIQCNREHPPPPNPRSVLCEDKIQYTNDYLHGTCILDVCTVF